MRWLDTIRDILSVLRRVRALEGKQIMTQDQIDALKAETETARAEFKDFATKTATNAKTLQDEIDALKAAPPATPLNFSGLQSAIDAIKADADAVDAP